MELLTVLGVLAVVAAVVYVVVRKGKQRAKPRPGVGGGQPSDPVIRNQD